MKPRYLYTPWWTGWALATLLALLGASQGCAHRPLDCESSQGDWAAQWNYRTEREYLDSLWLAKRDSILSAQVPPEARR